MSDADDVMVPVPLSAFAHLYLAVRACGCEQTELAQEQLDRAMNKLSFRERARVMQSVAHALPERPFT